MKTIRQRNNRKTSKKRKNSRKKMNKKRQRQSRKIYKKQHGGKFNEEQIEKIIKEMKNSPEPFTDEEIEVYINKLNDISQVQLSGLVDSFDLFYENMMNHLEGYEEETFKQWIDRVYDKQTENVETDKEEGDDHSDDEY